MRPHILALLTIALVGISVASAAPFPARRITFSQLRAMHPCPDDDSTVCLPARCDWVFVSPSRDDFVFVQGDSLSWEYPYETLGTCDRKPTRVDPHRRRATRLTYQFCSDAKLAILAAPITNLAADTSRSDSLLLDEVAQSVWSHSNEWVTPRCHRHEVMIPDTLPGLYRVAWIAFGSRHRGWRSENIRPTDLETAADARVGRVVGRLVIDPERNRFVWWRGRAHSLP
ncbi:MAG TPA: hypothetical protein VMS88_07335 [Terriglobales bacterium]|nr:hypothetical protein [Terriglobales bacterium]